MSDKTAVRIITYAVSALYCTRIGSLVELESKTCHCNKGNASTFV